MVERNLKDSTYYIVMSIIDTEDLITSIVDNDAAPSEEELDAFKNLVNDWFKYDDQIRKLDTAIKERRNYQKALNGKIQDFMFRYKYNDLNTQHGSIKSNIKEVKVPIKVTEIRDKIMKYSNLSGEELVKQIFEEERQTVLKKNIKRVIPKVSLTL
jgi:hypothetical protein